MLTVQCISGENRKHGLHLQVLTPFEKLKQAQAVGRTIAPRSLMAGAIGEVAQGLLPVEALSDRVAFEIVAAGQAEEGGVHIGEQPHDVSAIAVLMSVIG